MAKFSYRGRNASGVTVDGVLEGATLEAVTIALYGRGITPLDVREAASESAGTGRSVEDFFAPRITHVDITLFCRQLYSLLKAGVPILRALAGLQESSSNKAMKALFQDVRESLDAGREFSSSLARHPKVFTPFFLSMVRVGEMTGRLEEVFLRLFHHLEFERFMREQVRSALRYPSFVVVAMAVATVIVNIFVIPAFSSVFAQFGADLPLMTRFLVGFSNFMVNYWKVMLLAVVGAIFAFRYWVGTSRGRYQWDALRMRIPIAGKVVRKATLARFCRSFALAIRSGVPIAQALTTVAQTVDNDYIAEKVERMRDGVERGESVLRTAIGTRVFTPVVLQMIAVGEESGSLEEMMQEVADMYQREVEYELKSLSQQLEPILIVFLGILVLVLALGIFLPIWDLGKAATRH
jgi:MSHA biogenesis protein MshG